jgi:Asp/Glu/hydantoin racemase
MPGKPMRVVMIHAVAGSIRPAELAFRDEFPEAELVNLMDDSLLTDYGDSINSRLRRRMSQLICYCAEHGADAVGLACSVYAPVVESARHLVDIPVLSSYEAVMDDAVSYGSRIGIIASVAATLRDSEYYLRQTAKQRGLTVDPQLLLDEDLMQLMKVAGQEEFRQRLSRAVRRMAPGLDAILLSQFSMATALSDLREVTDLPLLSAPHSSARRFKQLLTVPVG